VSGDIYTDIATIAGAVGTLERGEEVIAYMQTHIEEVRSHTRGLPRPKVFCEEWGKPIIASQGWVAELIEAAGGDVVAKPGEHLSEEAIIDLAPDVIVAAWCGAGNRVPLKKIVATRAGKNLPAARKWTRLLRAG